MTRRLAWLLGLAAILAVGYGIILIVQPDARPTGGLDAIRRYLPGGGAKDRERGSSHPRGRYEEVAVTVHIPSIEEKKSEEETSDRPGAAQGAHGGCPATQVSAILGIELGSVHGIIVRKVLPDGLAEKVGIQAGDGIARCEGRSVTCPSTLLPHIRPRQEGRDVELTLRRPKAEETESRSVEPAAKKNDMGE